SNTHQPVIGALVLNIITGKKTISNNLGEVSFINTENLNLIFKISNINYDEKIIQTNSSSEIFLNPTLHNYDEIVVSASKKPEKITQSPALINVISKKNIANIAAPNVVDLYSKIQGMEFIKTGVNSYTLNARGFNSAFNGKLLQFVDGRYSNVPGALSIPMGNMVSTIKEDIDKIEVVVGPNSALYGPNAHSGVVNIITKDPFKTPGFTTAITIGNQQTKSVRFRWASILNKQFAYKISGEYTLSENFIYTDSVYVGGADYGIPANHINERNPNNTLKNIRLDGSIHYKINTHFLLVLNAGYSKNAFLLPNNLGRHQINDWTNYFIQAKITSTFNYFQINYAKSDLDAKNLISYTRDYYNRVNSNITDPNNPNFIKFGRLTEIDAEKFASRPGNSFYDNANRLIAEYQRNFLIPTHKINIIGNISYQQDNPNTKGTIILDDSIPYQITQIGIAFQIEKQFNNNWNLFFATRVDNHNKFGWLLAPKISILKKINAQSSFRISYSQANAAPIIVFQKASVFGSLFGDVEGITYIPQGANINNPSQFKTIEPLQVETIKTIEIGYKGFLNKKLYIDADCYLSASKNFVSPAVSIPGRIYKLGDYIIPISKLSTAGTTNEAGILGNNANFLSYLNYGDVTSLGFDIGLKYIFSENIQTFLKYSWFGSGIIDSTHIHNDANRDGYVSKEESALNAPAHRITWQLIMDNFLIKHLNMEIGIRWLPEYDFYSGNQIATSDGAGKRGVVYGGINPINNQPRYYLKNFNQGPLGGFKTVDLSFLYSLNKHISVAFSATNLLDTKQTEFVGVPSIGRLLYVDFRFQF
ncbi:MAG: TonB-dependent receptor plug domain-containing protein, partial [Sediminibacterium sp.]|nr:TonB-dependent receptor plug domain-containing protein [Sediminibacterium sp.]